MVGLYLLIFLVLTPFCGTFFQFKAYTVPRKCILEYNLTMLQIIFIDQRSDRLTKTLFLLIRVGIVFQIWRVQAQFFYFIFLITEVKTNTLHLQLFIGPALKIKVLVSNLTHLSLSR